MRDAAISSEYAWKFIEDAKSRDLPLIGNLKTLDEIRHRRAHLENGYGLLRQKTGLFQNA